MGRLNAESMAHWRPVMVKKCGAWAWHCWHQPSIHCSWKLEILVVPTPLFSYFFWESSSPRPQDGLTNQKTCDTNNQRFTICKNQPTNENRTSMTQMLGSWSWGSPRYLVPDAFTAFTNLLIDADSVISSPSTWYKSWPLSTLWALADLGFCHTCNNTESYELPSGNLT